MGIIMHRLCPGKLPNLDKTVLFLRSHHNTLTGRPDAAGLTDHSSDNCLCCRPVYTHRKDNIYTNIQL